MTGILIYAAIAATICCGCHFMRATDKKALFCVCFGAAFFALTAYGSANSELIGTELPASFASDGADAGNGIFSPGHELLTALFSKVCDSPQIFMLLTAFVRSAAAALYLYFGCSEPFTPAAVLTLCFSADCFTGGSVFTAALIGAWAAKYLLEKRFFRFLGAVLLACCFDISAVLLVPVYFISYISNVYICSALMGALAALPVFFPEAADIFFSFLPAGFIVFERGDTAESTLFRPIMLICTALVFIVAHSMFLRRGEEYEKLIPLFFAGSVFSLAGFFDARLYPLSLMLCLPCVLRLVPEARAIGSSFVGIVFPEKKQAARTAALIIIYMIMLGCFMTVLLALPAGQLPGSAFPGV